jgi:protein gp37
MYGSTSSVNSETITLYTHENVAVTYPKPKHPPTFNQTPGEGISWAEWSWNPVTGCLHGCNYCYAREGATSERLRAVYPAGFVPLFHSERLQAPATTKIPAKHKDDPAWRRVFVVSMGDLYGRWVPAEWIQKVHDSMNANPQWEYLLLTKFPSRYLKFQLPKTAWVGTSVDEQRRVKLAEDAFRQIKNVKVKWLSLEPLLEPLEFTDLGMFDWVVIGAQTETNQPWGKVPAKGPEETWVKRLMVQARKAGCKIHLKPNLKPYYFGPWVDEYPVT